MAVPSTPTVSHANNTGTTKYQGPITFTAQSTGSTIIRYEKLEGTIASPPAVPSTPTSSSPELPSGGISLNAEVTKLRVVGFNSDGASGYAQRSLYIEPGVAGRTVTDALLDAEAALAAAEADLADVQTFLDEAQTLA